MPGKNNVGELDHGEILLKPSASDNYIVVACWVLCIIFVWAFLASISPSDWYYQFANIVGGGAIGFLIYRTWVAINNLRTGKIFIKLTSSGIQYRNVEKTHDIAWGDISEFLIEENAYEFGREATIETETQFYVVAKGNSDKIHINLSFGYDKIDLAKLMAGKMRQSLNLSLDHKLVSMEKMVYGKPISKYWLDNNSEHLSWKRNT